MKKTDLVVTNPKGMTARVSSDRLERILIDICGGGYTARQTANAMALGHRVRSGEKVKHDGWTLHILREEPVKVDRYTLYVAPGTNQCRLYLMPYPMRLGQKPSDICHEEQRKWEHVGLLTSSLKVTYLDERLHHLHSELEGAMGGTYFELDGDFQFVDGPAMAASV